MRVYAIENRLLAWDEYKYCGCHERAAWETVIKRNRGGKLVETKLYRCYDHQQKEVKGV